MLADGLHEVPAGKVAEVVTSLEMLEPPPLRPDSGGVGWTLRRMEAPTAEDYLAL